MAKKPVPQTSIPIPQQILNLKAEPEDIEYAWNKYVAANKKFINKTLLINQSYDYYDRELKIPLVEATKACGKIRIDKSKQRPRVWHTFFKLYPFFRIHRIGNNSEGEITRIIPIKDRLREIEAETTIFDKFFPDLTEAEISALDMVPIDQKSLGNYIKTTNQEDIKQAQAIYDIVNECQSKGITTTPLLPYNINPSPFGRTYHRGVNLQTCKKEIRHLSLGKCWEYDLNAAVVAVKLTMMEKLYDQTGDDIDAHYPCSVEYLDHKNPIREQLRDVLYNARLARHQSDPKNNGKPDKESALADIKKSFTAISFGGGTGNSCWFNKAGKIQYAAFASIIPDKGDRKIVQDARDKFLRKFIKEQKAMTEKIVAHFLAGKGDKALLNKYTTQFGISGLPKNRLMAYIYQHRETEIIDQLEAGITAKLKTNPVILRVHDGFYSSRKIPMALIDGILDKIQYANCKDFRGFIKASEDPINP